MGNEKNQDKKIRKREKEEEEKKKKKKFKILDEFSYIYI